MPKKAIRIFKHASKQIDDKADDLFWNRDWVIEPEIDFDALLFAYENSSIISWVVKKISSKIDSWFEKTENETLNTILENLDIETISQNLLTFWNSFSERLKNWYDENLLEFENILTPTIRIANKKKESIYFYQRSKKWITKVGFSKQEILFFKRNSLWDKYYWDSIFASCIDEVVLLAYITKYYKNFFSSGNIEPNVLYDEEWTLTDKQIDKLEEMIHDKISWIDNSHNTIFVPSKIWRIKLTTDINPEAFIALKRELKEDISISTNIPFDLLSSQNSNKANSIVALESLYSDIIIPLQNKILRQLKKQLLDWKKEEKETNILKEISEDEINEIKFIKINLKDGLDEMKIAVWYKKAWITTPNEERSKLWLDELPWGDILQTSWKSEFDNEEDTDIDEVNKKLNKSYSKWEKFLNKIWIK